MPQPEAAIASRDAPADRRVRAAVAPHAALRLVLAGHLLQRRGHRIERRKEEGYPLAVQRALDALPEAQRRQIEDEVEFLLSLGPDGLPSEALRRRWRDRWPPSSAEAKGTRPDTASPLAHD